MTSPFDKLGFSPIWPARTGRDIDALFAGAGERQRCGLYLLEMADYTHYIGKSVDLPKRIKAHRQEFKDMAGVAFVVVEEADLTRVEREKIRQGEKLGLCLHNIDGTTHVSVKTAFDAIMLEEEQVAWLANPAKFNKRDRSPPIELPADKVARGERSLARLLALPHGLVAVQLLSTYLRNCIPAPFRTETSHWSVSCLPGRRLLCVNAAGMEMLVLAAWNSILLECLVGFVIVDRLALFPNASEKAAFRARHPSARTERSEYEAAGDKRLQLRVWADGPEAMVALLGDPKVQHAAAVLALRVMRKCRVKYAYYHCGPLARHALQLKA